MKVCKLCEKKLRADNKIGFCRAHRSISDSRKEYMREYANNNKEKVLENKRRHYPKAAKRNKERRKVDPEFKIATILRTRLNTALQRRGKTKASGVRNLGCTIQEFKAYLEKFFKPGMNWNNHGEWHIDHIKPLASFDLTNEADLKAACHYTNLQPLWAAENIKKRDRT